MAVRIFEGLFKVERWRLNILLSYLITDQSLQGLSEFISSHDSQDDQSVEVGDFAPLARPLLGVRVVRLIELSELFVVSFYVRNQGLKSSKSL